MNKFLRIICTNLQISVSLYSQVGIKSNCALVNFFRSKKMFIIARCLLSIMWFMLWLLILVSSKKCTNARSLLSTSLIFSFDCTEYLAWGLTLQFSLKFVQLLLLTKFSNHSINNMIDSKHLTIVNIFAPLKKFTKARFDCIFNLEMLIT